MKRSQAPSALSQGSKRVKYTQQQPSKRTNRFAGIQRSKGPEHKFVDVVQNGYVADTAGTITLLNGVAQGLDYNNRIGRKMEFTSVHVKGILLPVDTSTAPAHCRLMVVWDSDSDGTTPTITDILAQSTSTSFANLNNRNRFRTLLNEEYSIGGFSAAATTAYAGAPQVHTIDRYVQLPKLETINQGTDATAASIQQGALWMLTIGTNAASNGGFFIVSTRARYTDN